jgi:hypothetical protein
MTGGFTDFPNIFAQTKVLNYTFVPSRDSREGSLGRPSAAQEFLWCSRNYQPFRIFSFLQSQKNADKTLKCPKCNWHYKYIETLEAHIREKHGEEMSNTGNQFIK